MCGCADLRNSNSLVIDWIGQGARSHPDARRFSAVPKLAPHVSEASFTYIVGGFTVYTCLERISSQISHRYRDNELVLVNSREQKAAFSLSSGVCWSGAPHHGNLVLNIKRNRFEDADERFSSR